MTTKRQLILPWLAGAVGMLLAPLLLAAPAGDALHLHGRKLERIPGTADQWSAVDKPLDWNPRQTAVVICDMWNQHWCKGATARVAEMAPRMNQVISALRAQGVLIIHCPSDTMKYYEGTPGRKLAQSAPKVETSIPLQGGCGLDTNRESALPIDDSDGGCNDDPPCQQGSPWTHEIDTLQIKDGDAITDSAEAYYLMRERGITNVIVMGVHENMCVLGRPFSIRQMVYQGQNVVLMRDLTDSMYNSRSKPWVDHFTGVDLLTWHIEKFWCPTITSDQILGGEPFHFAADTNAPRVFHNFVKLPKSDGHYKITKDYVEDTPNPDYWQASDADREAFRDLKFGIRIHWGVYAKLGVDASWPLLKMSNQEKMNYEHLYESFNPTNFNAEDWMNLFQTNGVKLFAFTSKHHDGFSMFDTKTRVARRVNWTAPGGPQIENCDFAYSIMDTPFHRDIIKELTDAAHEHGMKIDLYFSHPDWYDADFRPFAENPLHDRVNKAEHPDQWNHFVQRHRQQLTELLSNYGKIDYMCLDQYFDQTAWLDLRQTMKIIRKIQPDCMFRCRGIGNYGDYYTPENFVPGSKENTDMPWMVIDQLAGIWSYQPDMSQYRDGKWIVTNLVDIVAKGGNFMFGIGPDGTGKFAPKAITALQYAGAWLRINGEGVYNTRPRPGDDWKEGGDIRFTRTKDNKTIYAFDMKWPGSQLILSSVTPHTSVQLIGDNQPLSWHLDALRHLVIDLPDRLQSAENRPSQPPYAFKIE